MSQLEESFAMYWARFGSGEKPVRQFKFDITRKWLADFAWPDAGLLVEIQGGQWVRGRHNRGGGDIVVPYTVAYSIGAQW